MSDDLDKVQQEAKRVQKELNENGLSRRGMLNRFNFMGLGFGAAYLLGAQRADALTRGDDKPDVKIKSTNPALNDIIEDGQAPGGEAADDQRPIKTAWFRRWYFRGYRRFGGYRRFWGYRRWFRRW
jgi:hypothetical protein